MINDEVFGQLSYEYMWSKRFTIDFFGNEFDIVILIDGEQDEPFEEGQYQAYIKLLETWDNVHRTFIKFILEYYTNRRYVLGYDVEANIDYPEILTEEEMLKHITIVGINIPYEGIYGGRSIGVSFDCTWDTENGVGIRLKDEKVIEVGFQEIAI